MSDDFAPRRFKVSVNVFPPIPMVRTNAVALARELSSRLALNDIHWSDEVWTYSQRSQTEGEPRGVVRIQVKETEVSIEHRFPATPLERFETLVGHVFESFATSGLSPDFVFSTEVDLTYEFDLGLDSRHAMLSELGLVSPRDDRPDRVLSFGRPCYQVGLRLLFPPYEIDDEEEDPGGDEPEPGAGSGEIEIDKSADWRATVTIQTHEEHVNKVMVTIDGAWHGPQPWENISASVVEKLAATKTYMQDRVLGFLKHFQREGENDGSGNDG